MGARLPVVSGRAAARAFERAGWVFDRQRGSHMIYIKPGVQVNLSIPNHHVLGPGLLRGLIRKSGLRVMEFVRLLES